MPSPRPSAVPVPPEGTPPPEGRPAPARRPAVVAADRRQVARRQARREWGRSLPWLLVALAAHLLLLAWYQSRVADGDGRAVPILVSAALEPAPDEPPPDAPWEQPELEEPVEPPPAAPDAEPPPEDSREPDDRAPGEADVLGLGAAGFGGHGGAGGVGPAGDVTSVPAGPGVGAFEGYVGDLRRRGLDVVLVVDATGSMQRFIDRARETLDGIVADLCTVVPGLRLGLVAYRDLGDDWVTRAVDLTADRYRVQNTLAELKASGGYREFPDFEEAVEEGLRVAVEELDWRPAARRVILLVGDAPYHDEDATEALGEVRRFARDAHSVVNTIWVGDTAGAIPTDSQQRAREVFARLAHTGGGLAFELVTDDPAADAVLRQQVLDATFGAEWREQVAAFLAERPVDGRQAMVRRHAGRGDSAWLIDRLADPPLEPAVVEGCVQAFDGPIAAACLALVDAGEAPPELRSAALFILQRGLPAARVVPFDAYAPPGTQPDRLAALRRAVESLPGAAPSAPAGGAARLPPVPGGG